MCAASLGDSGDGAAWQRGAHDAVVGQGQAPKVSKGDLNQRVKRLWLHFLDGAGRATGPEMGLLEPGKICKAGRRPCGRWQTSLL
jgi:hypothetical protein